MAAGALGTDMTIEREAEGWMNDPYGHFNYHNTRIHSLPREEVEAVQLAAMNRRLAERRGQIKMLAKLADGQGITQLNSLDDMAPLLMPHDIYKSYPVSLLARQRFDQITTWLSRLTRYDPTGVDMSKCDSIDSWLTKLRAETPLDVATSSGSSGTCSFFPKSKKDYFLSALGMRVQLAQKFGENPKPGDLEDKIHTIIPLYRDGHASTGAFAKYFGEVFAKNDESYQHICFNFKISSDLMWLAARLRAAAARGDAANVDVPPSLLARRAEWEAAQKDMPRQQLDFVTRMIKELHGNRVFVMGTSNLLYAAAKRGLEEGISGTFAPDSVFMGGGGAKGVPLPADLEEVICKFFGTERMISAYGMTEMNSFSVLCDHDHYHVLPWVTVYLLDLDTGRPLPRTGVQTGRAAFFDMTQDSTWGGLITGDLVTIDWDHHCACGRTSVALQKNIGRVSDIKGGDDKISCAATPQAQAEAMDFLTGFGG
jgi:acyl-CoA synthetase (AMP-forming)/AMP-acid ligase II